jgi:hypothetical protein
VVVADTGRVEELRAAVRRPGVHEDDECRRTIVVGEERIDQLDDVRPERRAVAPHVDLPGVALDQVDRRKRRLTRARRGVDPERTLVGVTEAVPAQGLALEHVLVEASDQIA